MELLPGVDASSITNHLVTIPNNPTGVNASVVTTTEVAVSWTAPTSTSKNQPTQYLVYCGTSSSSYSLVTTVAFGTNTAFIYPGSFVYAPNVPYYYAVVSQNSAGENATIWGAQNVSNSVIPFNPPSSPTISAFTPQTISGNSSPHVSSSGSTATASVAISWTPGTITNGNTPTGYSVMDTLGNNYATVAYGGSNSTSFTFSASANQYYSFVVDAYNASGASQSASSTTYQFFTVPATPTIGSASVVSTTQVQVSFSVGDVTNYSAPTSYTVHDNVTGAIVNGTSSPLTITETFSQGTSYSFSVYATNGAGNSALSSSTSSVIPNPVIPPPPPPPLPPPPPSTFTLNYYVQGGGGGGGAYTGGGAGGYVNAAMTATVGTNYSGLVGNGGTGTTSTSSTGGNGGTSTFNAHSGNGGAGGGSVGTYKGSGGASGSPQGYAGGAGSKYAGGGGGGTGGAGGSSTPQTTSTVPGNGGASASSATAWLPSPLNSLGFYPGQGGPGSNTSGANGTGGNGTGAGGPGSTYGYGWSGSGGVVLLYWLTSAYSLTPTIGGTPPAYTGTIGPYSYVYWLGSVGGGGNASISIEF